MTHHKPKPKTLLTTIMTHRKPRPKPMMITMMLGLTLGTTMVGAAAARAETDAACFSAVVQLYVAERVSGSLDYLVCKATCGELAPSERSACRLGCRQDRAATTRAAREDADALRLVCDGGVAVAQRTDAAPVPSTCGPDLSDCAANARTSAKACDHRSDDLTTFSVCAADVSAAVDQCAADFVNCAVPAEESAGQ